MNRRVGAVAGACLVLLLGACDPGVAGEAEIDSQGAAVSSTSTRPQLSDSAATGYTAATYLARAGTVGSLTTDNWNPTSGVGDTSAFTARYTVAADGSGNYRTIQEAISATSGSSRVYIEVKPGTYREVVCVSSGKPPLTLYSKSSDASQTVVVYDNSAPKPKSSGTAANACNPNSSATTYGTTSSATFTVQAAGFQAKNLTFSNDYVEGTYSGSNQQAVALMTSGDKAVFENVRALGNQDTLYVSTSGYDNVARAYFKGSYIQGDVDFIFGRGTAVFDGCTIQYLSSREGSNASYVIAPATAAKNDLGFLFVNSHFSADGSAPSNKIYLGRSWDEGVSSGAYVAGTSPNGQAVIRNCTLDGHIRLTDPWGTSTSSRAYSSSGNRFSEYLNVGSGSGNTGFTLTVAVSGDGSTSPAAGAHVYPTGTVVSVTAAPGSGSKFAGWSGACSGTGTCTVTVSSNLTVTASFQKAQDTTPPSTPSGLDWRVDGSDGMTVSLSWSASTDDTGVVAYELYYGNFYLGAFSDTGLSLIGFKAGTPYTFTVKARDAAGNTSAASNQITVLLSLGRDTTPPSAPGNLAAGTVTSSAVALSWTASTDDVGVVVYQVFAGGSAAAATSTSTRATIAGLAAGTSYGFTVKAIDAAGNVSSPSAALVVTTAP